jgi:CubicO group peptidase (beta-lactamase class C family)
VSHTGAARGKAGVSLSELFARARRDVDEGVLPSCQLAVARDGELVAWEGFGSVQGSRYTVFSITKGLVAAAVWLLVSEELLTFETHVADLVPEFAAHGKDAVTVDHLLLHTAGFPRAPMRPEEGADPAARLERFATWTLDWTPGTRTEYHPTSAHWVLAEVIERASGLDFRTFVNERICAALELDFLRLGFDELDQRPIVDVVITGEPAQMGTITRTDGQELTIPEIRPDILLRYNEPKVRAAGVPGSGAVGNAADVAMLFQAMIRNPDSLWKPDVLADATGTLRNSFPDPYTTAPANRSRGVVLAGDDGFAVMRSFGEGVSARAFASPGVGGQIAWADPATGVSFCYLTNGLDSDLVRAFRRSMKLSTLAAAAL